MSRDHEEWRQIAESPDYDVSDWGRVRSRRRRGEPIILMPRPHSHGYHRVNLYHAGVVHDAYVHRLVLEAFAGLCPPRHNCRHLDGNPANNRPENLAWGTWEEQWEDKVRNGTGARRVEPPPYEPVLFADPFVPVEAIMPETWKDIPGAEGYQVSNTGKVRSFRSSGRRPRLISAPHLLAPASTGARRQYQFVNVAGKQRYVHRLVIETFSGPRPPGLDCRHLDGNSRNNHISNLRWSTRRENLRDKLLHGTHQKGERHARAVLTETQVVEIRRRHAQGTSYRKLAEEYNVSTGHVGAICNRLTWKHI
jgi:hypothetical protein